MLKALVITMSVSAPLLTTAVATAGEPTGEELYGTYCTQCHGTLGDGWGINTRDIEVVPRDHTEKGEMSARTDEELFKAIKSGGKAVNKSILMPNWDAVITDDEIHRIVGYLRELCDCSAN